MSSDIKTGQEVIDNFIEIIKQDKRLDEETVNIFNSLYEEGKLTKTNILNKLEEVRNENK